MRLFPAAATTLLLVAGCTGPAPAAVPPQAPPAFGGTDLAWIEVTLAMNEQVTPLLDAVPARAHGTAVRDLAARVRGFTDAELPVLRALHDRAGLPAQNPHVGMPMPGMVSAAELAAMTRLTGPAFDAAATAELQEGITQAVALARSEQQHGADPETRALAAAMLAARTGTDGRSPGRV